MYTRALEVRTQILDYNALAAAFQNIAPSWFKGKDTINE